MKARKVAELNDIFSESAKLIRLFKPQPNLIKKRIDSLMERDYIKRDEK